MLLKHRGSYPEPEVIETVNMPHYLIIKEETLPGLGVSVTLTVRGPVEAVNPEQAVMKEDMSVDPTVQRGKTDITVWPLQEGPRGKPESWSKEDLDL